MCVEFVFNIQTLALENGSENVRYKISLYLGYSYNLEDMTSY